MSARFVTTQWSLVLAAGDSKCAQAREALEILCDKYWYPLYTYVRSYGYGAEQAKDVIQAFFADLLERQAFKGLAPEKGRFRSFMLASIRNFLSHERAKEQALKRGGSQSIVSLDVVLAERQYRHEPMTVLSPDHLFERRWGLMAMERAMTRLENQAQASGKADVFLILRPYLTGNDGASYRQAAEELSMSIGAVKVAVHRLRQSYGRFLREEIADTVVDRSQVDDELRHLLTKIRPWQI